MTSLFSRVLAGVCLVLATAPPLRAEPPAATGAPVGLADKPTAPPPTSTEPGTTPPTSAPEPDPASITAASAGAPLPLHVGVFDPSTPSARQLAADVAELVVRAARLRGTFTVTQDTPDTWLTEDHFRHEGALLACMDPFFTRSEVLACISRLVFPPMPKPVPEGARFQVAGTVRTAEAGIVVTLFLQPVMDGWPGPSMVTREITVSRRMRRPARERALLAAVAPLFDAAEGRETATADPPAPRPRGKKRARKDKP